MNLLADIDMLLMVEEGIRDGKCHAVYPKARANNKYMKTYDENWEAFCLKCWDVNNLYEWTMSQTLPVRYLLR